MESKNVSLELESREYALKKRKHAYTLAIIVISLACCGIAIVAVGRFHTSVWHAVLGILITGSGGILLYRSFLHTEKYLVKQQLRYVRQHMQKEKEEIKKKIEPLVKKLTHKSFMRVLN